MRAQNKKKNAKFVLLKITTSNTCVLIENEKKNTFNKNDMIYIKNDRRLSAGEHYNAHNFRDLSKI